MRCFARPWLLIGLALAGCPAVNIGTNIDCEENPEAQACQSTDAGPGEIAARLFVDPPFGTGFECVAIGCIEERTFKVENRGGRDLHVSLVRTSVDTSSEFTLRLHPILDGVLDTSREFTRPSSTSPVILKAGAQFAIVVRYAPNDANADEGVLQIDWYDGEKSYNDAILNHVELALSTRVLGSAVADLTNAVLNFGYVPAGTTKTLAVEITNTTEGNATLEIAPPVFASGTSSTFRVDMETPVFVAAGESIEIPVHFTPSSTTAFFGALYFATNDGGRPQLSIQLKGTAIEGPWYELASPSNFVADFGDLRVGDSRSKEVTIRNLGGLPLFVTPALEQGAELGFSTNVTVDIAMPALNPLEERTFSVSSTPTIGGEVAGRMGFTTNDPSLPYDWIDLRTYGIAPDAAFSSTTLAFGPIVQTWIAPAQTVDIWNQGTGEMTIGGIEFELGSSSQVKLVTTPTLPMKLAQGDVVSLSVFVDALTLGPANATLLIHTDSIVEPTRRVDVTATVVSCDEGCPMANGTPSCTTGSCQVGACYSGWHNADQAFSSGCECGEDTASGDVGGACFNGVNVGPLGDSCSNNQSSTTRTGTLHDINDVDLYYFFADDGGSAFCDTFGDSFRIKVELNAAAPAGLEFCYRHANDGCGGENQRICGNRVASFANGSYGTDDDTWATIWVRWAPGSNPVCGNYTITFRANDG
jgi:hypothetical protein